MKKFSIVLIYIVNCNYINNNQSFSTSSITKNNHNNNNYHYGECKHFY